MSATEKDLLTNILLIGAVTEALLAEKIGRRPTVLDTAAVFADGVLLGGAPPDGHRTASPRGRFDGRGCARHLVRLG